ncbi:MAG: hypothetical protein JWO38_2390 [Gemmataceae bacterium]|nr:hypothetical protein [Gemmataceae bacterium]
MSRKPKTNFGNRCQISASGSRVSARFSIFQVQIADRINAHTPMNRSVKTFTVVVVRTIQPGS